VGSFFPSSDLRRTSSCSTRWESIPFDDPIGGDPAVLKEDYFMPETDFQWYETQHGRFPLDAQIDARWQYQYN